MEPAWLVAKVAPFVCGDAGSLRDLHHALWEVRLTVILMLYHWKLRAMGAWTVPLPPPVAGDADRLLARALSHATRVQT